MVRVLELPTAENGKMRVGEPGARSMRVTADRVKQVLYRAKTEQVSTEYYIAISIGYYFFVSISITVLTVHYLHTAKRECESRA